MQALPIDRPLPPSVLERYIDLLASAAGVDDPGNDTWQAWNLSREKARELFGR